MHITLPVEHDEWLAPAIVRLYSPPCGTHCSEAVTSTLDPTVLQLAGQLELARVPGFAAISHGVTSSNGKEQIASRAISVCCPSSLEKSTMPSTFGSCSTGALSRSLTLQAERDAVGVLESLVTILGASVAFVLEPVECIVHTASARGECLCRARGVGSYALSIGISHFTLLHLSLAPRSPRSESGGASRQLGITMKRQGWWWWSGGGGGPGAPMPPASGQQ
jgi:hypothetical protein